MRLLARGVWGRERTSANFQPLKSTEQASPSAEQSRIGCQRTADVARFAHLGARVAAQLWIRALIHDISAAVLLHAEPLLERLDALVATATATFAETLDDSERATAILHLQNAAAVADQASEQVAGGHRSPSAAAPVFVDVEPGWLVLSGDG